MRILVVEDYGPLRTSLAQGLREAGFAVDAADNGRDGLWHARSGEFDVVILDVMLPVLDGWSVLRRIRQDGCKSHVLMLTARDRVEDRVTGLDLGADDYLVKPFAFEELLARVRALVRRAYVAKDPVIRIADVEIDTAARTVRRGDERIDLTAREYALLEFLAMRAGELVTRTDIWAHLYDSESTAHSNVVDVYVGYLRRKLERPGGPRLLHTRRGQGYVFGESG